MSLRNILSLIVLITITNFYFAPAIAQEDFNLITGEQKQDELSKVDTQKTISTTAEAVSLAVADLGTMDDQDKPYQRYIWVPEPSEANTAAVNYAINIACSRSSVIIDPTIVDDGKLLRYDLRSLAPQDSQLDKLMKIWEQFQYEPYFHITETTKDAIPANAVHVDSRRDDSIGSLRFKIDDQLWYRSADGKFYIYEDKWIQVDPPVDLKDQDVSVYGAHCGLKQSTLLQGLTKSNASIIRYDYFITKALTTLDSNRVGGMYYEFVGIERNPNKGTAQQAFLDSLGADEKLVKQLRSDQRAAMFRSNVTGKPRRIDAFQGSGVRPGSGTGLITITHDLADNNVDPNTDPIRNLLNFEDDAREIIAEKPNGLHIFALFDGDGGLQDSAPDDVVKDHTIPAPHTARLQPAISCIRCHGPNEGLQPFQNDVQVMLSGLLDVFDDLDSDQAIPDTLDRLAGLYAGDLTKPIERARDDYSSAVFKATNGLSVPDISAKISQIYGNYNFKLVDAQTACLELGYVVPEGDAVKRLNEIIPPLSQDVVGISPEDPIIGALKSGLTIQRYQWEQVFGDAAFRAMRSALDQDKANP